MLADRINRLAHNCRSSTGLSATSVTSTDLDLRLASYALTDLGNGERFVERNRNKLLCRQAFGWLRWDGKRWTADGADSAVTIAAHDAVRAIVDEAQALLVDATKTHSSSLPAGRSRESDVLERARRLKKWAHNSETSRRLSAMPHVAKPYLSVAQGDLDRDPFLLNVENGTLVIRKDRRNAYITRRPHDPADGITKLARAVYDPKATCPVFDRFWNKFSLTRRLDVSCINGLV